MSAYADKVEQEKCIGYVKSRPALRGTEWDAYGWNMDGERTLVDCIEGFWPSQAEAEAAVLRHHRRMIKMDTPYIPVPVPS